MESQGGDFPDFIDKLEEGRIALHQLERHLKDAQRIEKNEDAHSVGSQQKSLRSERSMLDQVSRESRMHYRKDSPLGLTVEELDDRGLLDGGSVPKYYTSMRQKGRRPLELRKRGERIQERDKESVARSFEFFFHMIRTLAKRGVRIEEYCRQYDMADCGMVPRKRFLSMIKNMGLPLSQKDVLEIAQRYTVDGSEMVDFDKLLVDSQVQDANLVYHERSDFGEGDESLTEQRACTGVLPDVKRMLIDSVRSLGKTVEEVYGMFARWDNVGNGTVTSTQFLRVLARLHVNLSDEDQDFLVELLDANAQGRVHFESLLSFCFTDKRSATTTANVTAGLASPTGAEEEGEGGESLSVVSADGLHEQRSTGPVRRPRTASDQDRQRSRREQGQYNTGVARRSADGQLQAVTPDAASSKSARPQRPLTASGRVSGTQEQRPRDSQTNGSDDREHVEVAVDLGEDDDEQFPMAPRTGVAYVPAPDSLGGGSLNDNTLVTDPEQEEFGSPTGVTMGKQSRGPELWNSTSLDGITVSQDQLPEGSNGLLDSPYRVPNLHVPPILLPPASAHATLVGSTESQDLISLAKNALATVRELVVLRHHAGHSLAAIFRHFDRNEIGVFTPHEFMSACRDLHVEVPIEVARAAVSILAIDDPTAASVCYAEFAVFVLDEQFRTLEETVCLQLARQLEIQGRRFINTLNTVFWPETDGGMSANRPRVPPPTQGGSVSRDTFLTALSGLGLQLSTADQQRLCTRFDVNGDGYCSVDRFLRSVLKGTDWKAAEANLPILEEARREAAELLRLMNEGRQPPGLLGVSKETISMAEYLGIRPRSESHLLWIAVDALKAPLPLSWTAQSDSFGRTFFYNSITRESSWDHPLDPYFRNLRDKYRREGTPAAPMPGANGRVADFVQGGGLYAPSQPPLNLKLGHQGLAGPNPSAAMSGNANISQKNARPQSAHASGSRVQTAVLPRMQGTSSGAGQHSPDHHSHFSQTHAAVQYALATQPVHLMYPDVEWVNEPARAKGGRPGSAPSTDMRNKKHFDKSRAIYNSEYFNLSHYKQGGYNVEQLEADMKARNKASVGVGIAASRPQSSGGTRRQQSGGAVAAPIHAASAQAQGGAQSSSRATASFGAYGVPAPNAQHVPGQERYGSSVVDRALYGTPVPMYLQPREKAQHFVPQPVKVTPSTIHALLQVPGRGSSDRLQEMYDDNVLQRLDQIVRPNGLHGQSEPLVPPVVTATPNAVPQARRKAGGGKN